MIHVSDTERSSKLCSVAVPGRRCRRAGFTLIEQVVSLSVISVLMTGLGSVIVLATNVLPSKNTPLVAVVESSQIVEQIAAELHTANSISERTATSIAFTVPDRNNDAVDETIRYAWSGTSGAPLTRRYNAAAIVEIAPSVKSFNLNYVTTSITTSTKTESTTDDAEQVVGYFDGWTGITNTSVDRMLNNSNYVSEYFTVTPPADATKLRITRARAMLKRGGTAPGNFTLAIRRSLNDGSYQPAATSVGTPVSVLGTSLFASYLWTTVNFSDVAVTDFSRKDFCLVITGSTAITFSAQSYMNAAAPADPTVLTWTTNAGTGWLPSSSIAQQDLRFYVYGVYTRATTTTVDTTSDSLAGVSITLRTNDEAGSRLDTFAQCVNAPDVTGL